MNDGHKLVFFQVRANKSQICKTFFPHDFGHQKEFLTLFGVSTEFPCLII